ncbi:YcxB family protein [Orbus wheelerorum]|uniref:YcxB family protein n=1 Tax=Orbus wheelerorum TaxID=3074111 RepID=UPI00370D6344
MQIITYHEDDFIRVSKLIFLQNLKKLRSCFIFIVFLILVSFFIYFFLPHIFGGGILIGIFMASALIVILSFLITFFITIPSDAKKKFDLFRLDNQFIISWDETYLYSSSRIIGESKLFWSIYSTVIENSNYIAFLSKAGTVTIFPKRCFDENNLQDFKRYCVKYIENRH